jgi:hypothetical protein
VLHCTKQKINRQIVFESPYGTRCNCTEAKLVLRAYTAAAVEVGIVNRERKWQGMQVSERLANLEAIHPIVYQTYSTRL